jgi:predicted nucleic acid-binding protein
VIVVDTSGLLSALDASEPRHDASARALRGAGAPRILSPFVLAELDYLLAKRISPSVARRLLDEVADGAYELAQFDAAASRSAAGVLDRYHKLELGLADASILVLADRYGTRDLLTLDERHFRAVRASDGRPFRILPADG